MHSQHRLRKYFVSFIDDYYLGRRHKTSFRCHTKWNCNFFFLLFLFHWNMIYTSSENSFWFFGYCAANFKPFNILWYFTLTFKSIVKRDFAQYYSNLVIHSTTNNLWFVALVFRNSDAIDAHDQNRTIKGILYIHSVLRKSLYSSVLYPLKSKYSLIIFDFSLKVSSFRIFYTRKWCQCARHWRKKTHTEHRILF